LCLRQVCNQHTVITSLARHTDMVTCELAQPTHRGCHEAYIWMEAKGDKRGLEEEDEGKMSWGRHNSDEGDEDEGEVQRLGLVSRWVPWVGLMIERHEGQKGQSTQ
jgi:hypothetical protein